MPHKGYKQTMLHRKNIGMAIRDQKHGKWKGDKVGHTALHIWLVRRLGKPKSCEHCDKKNLTGVQIHWANKSHTYKRDKKDWIRLCVKCHRKYDGSNLNRKRGANGRFTS